MHPSETQIQSSNSSTSSMDELQHQYHDQDLDDQLDHDQDLDLVSDDNNNNNNNSNNNLDQGMVSMVGCEPLYCTDNNPPDSYAVCDSKVTDWLNNRSTFIERKTSVKFACTKSLDPCQTTRSNRRVCLNQKPKLSIIGFRKKPVHQTDGKSKHNDKVENVRLFKNRSEPGRDYCLLITEPVSPKVSCVGRVGSVRVQGRKAGVWRSFKAAFSNLVQVNRVGKIAA